MAPRILVLTVVHHPHDARIYHRQLAALLAAGWQVTYAAPFSGYGLDPDAETEVDAVDLRRATGRSRWQAQKAARRLLRRLGPRHDLVLLHDPDLVPTTLGLRLPPVVWDVHEDTAAAVSVRRWISRALRPAISIAVRGLERAAERRMSLLLADHRYAARFRRPHPIVPNATAVPDEHVPAASRPAPGGIQRVVYLGSVTVERGVHEMIEVARLLRERSGGRAQLEVIGPAHGPAQALLHDAAGRGDVQWHGFVDADRALSMLDGALAGLSLLHDSPNFRPSMPTKVVEYLARGVPAITTPLPLAAELVQDSGGGFVVPFVDVSTAVEVILELLENPERAAQMGRRGREAAREAYDWTVLSHDFVAALERVAAAS